MRAAIATKYGPPEVLEIRDVEAPTPGLGEVLIKVRATTVTSADSRVRALRMPVGFGFMARPVFGLFRPRQPILGTELSGEIESIGRGVTRFAAGDAVFAFSGASMGCHAEYRTMPENGAIALKPARSSFEEAAALSFGGTTALSFLRRAGIRGGDRILINGASGCVGTAAVQLARHFGAEVTGVCSTANLELVRSIGANRVIDYSREHFTRNGETYDIIMDTAGTAPYSRAAGSLAEDGRLLLLQGSLPDLLGIPWVSLTSRRKVVGGPAPERAEDLRYLADLAERGEFRPVIDRCYPFERIAEAHGYVDSGRKRGNVIVTFAPGLPAPGAMAF